MLMSPGTHNGFPLRIEVEQMEEVEVEYNADFTSRMVGKVEYKALVDTVASVSACRRAGGSCPVAAPAPYCMLARRFGWHTSSCCRARLCRATHLPHARS